MKTSKKTSAKPPTVKVLTAAQIIARDMPGFRIVKRPAVTAHATPPDAVSPDLAEIRKRYGLVEKPLTGTSTVVLVEPKAGPGILGPKAVIISNGRIIGRQG